MTDQIERELSLPGTPADLWPALTDPDWLCRGWPTRSRSSCGPAATRASGSAMRCARAGSRKSPRRRPATSRAPRPPVLLVADRRRVRVTGAAGSSSPTSTARPCACRRGEAVGGAGSCRDPNARQRDRRRAHGRHWSRRERAGTRPARSSKRSRTRCAAACWRRSRPPPRPRPSSRASCRSRARRCQAPDRAAQGGTARARALRPRRPLPRDARPALGRGRADGRRRRQWDDRLQRRRRSASRSPAARAELTATAPSGGAVTGPRRRSGSG